MNFYRIQPNIYGALGEGCNPHPSLWAEGLKTVEFVFDDVPKDCITHSIPVFICTEALKSQLTKMKVSGASFDSVSVKLSDDLLMRDPNLKTTDLPKFNWLKVDGEPTAADIGVTSDFDLVVAKPVLDIMQLLVLDDAAVYEFPSGTVVQPPVWER